jgi:hypothetical protein
MEICEIFHETKAVTFAVSGFRQGALPVDCWADRSVVMEQLTDILRKILQGDWHFVLDFYEQGFEREILFSEDVRLG